MVRVETTCQGDYASGTPKAEAVAYVQMCITKADVREQRENSLNCKHTIILCSCGLETAEVGLQLALRFYRGQI